MELTDSGPATAVPIVLSPRSRRVATVVAVVLNVAWLAGHLAGGALFATARHIAGGTFGRIPTNYLWRPDLDPTAVQLASITDTVMWFQIPAIPLVLLSWQWLPARSRFAIAWALLLPLGMVGYIGYGTYLFE